MVLLFSFLLFLIGWIWTIAIGFKESMMWGVLNILFPPISTVVFAIKYKTAFVPTLLVIFGLLAHAYVFYINRF
jgi:hypothetical protein